MKRSSFPIILIILLLPLFVLPLLSAWLPPSYVWGHIRIPARGIYAEVYTTDHGPDCGCCGELWNGGTVTVGADLSAVQVGDMADLRGLDGEHLVLECVSITGVPAWLLEAEGDVLVVNGMWVYRFIRL